MTDETVEYLAAVIHAAAVIAEHERRQTDRNTRKWIALLRVQDDLTRARRELDSIRNNNDDEKGTA